MAEAAKREPRRIRLAVLLLVAVLLPVLVYAMLAVGERWLEARALARQATRLREEVLAARAENERLQAMISEARSDRAIETIAREELNLSRPGETAVILIAPTAMPTPSPTPRPVETPGRP